MKKLNIAPICLEAVYDRKDPYPHDDIALEIREKFDVDIISMSELVYCSDDLQDIAKFLFDKLQTEVRSEYVWEISSFLVDKRYFHLMDIPKLSNRYVEYARTTEDNSSNSGAGNMARLLSIALDPSHFANLLKHTLHDESLGMSRVWLLDRFTEKPRIIPTLEIFELIMKTVREPVSAEVKNPRAYSLLINAQKVLLRKDWQKFILENNLMCDVTKEKHKELIKEVEKKSDKYIEEIVAERKRKAELA